MLTALLLDSVSTSLKALANSLGLKRALSKTSSNSKIFPTTPDPELDEHAVPYSSLPPANSLPQTDHFKLSTPDVSMVDGDVSMDVPGGPARPGAPAPANARLSTGEGLTTTIRLVSGTRRDALMSPPKLQPYKTSFDLIMSPDTNNSGHHISVWPPASPATQGRLYPSLDELMSTNSAVETPHVMASPAPALSAAKRTSLAMPIDQPGDIFSPKKHLAAGPSSVSRASIPRSEPFLFGSPLPANRPRTSNADFEKAAASVLNEMNQRLAASGVQGFDANVLNQKTTTNTDVFGGASNLARQRTDSTADRFAKAHDDVFSKMDSIATHYAARRAAPVVSNSTSFAQPLSKKRKSDALGLGPAPGPTKRKSSAANARVISTGVRKKMGIPGGFGDDEDDGQEQEVEDAGDRRSSKRIRVEEGQDIHKGRRVSLMATVAGDQGETEEDRAKEERKREAMKRKLDESRARRRSSRGRVSVGGKAVPSMCFCFVLIACSLTIVLVKPKTSRFGFLSSAKSLVRNVWNMGAGGNGAAAKAPSSIPVPKATIQPKTNAPTSQTKQAPDLKPALKSSSLGLGKPSTSKSTDRLSAARISSTGTSGKASMLSTDTAGTRKTSSSRSRSPIPTFNTRSEDTDNKAPAGRTRTGSTVGTASRIPSRTTSTSGFSSMGTRTSMTTSGTNAVSSIGTKRSLGTTGSSASRLRMDSTDSKIPPVPRRSSSTLWQRGSSNWPCEDTCNTKGKRSDCVIGLNSY